ncbi:MAG: DUF1211 domain-containing protein [Anaerolineaceae bacterium]|nr:DUF1211 domain-containing protein [Anaerolineaceae bacterium]
MAREGLSRLTGLTDGVFAIALTLMVLELHVPDGHKIGSELELLSAIGTLAPQFITYALSFLTLTIFWFGQQAQHSLMRGTDRKLATLHLCFLAFVSLLPFSTGILAEFHVFRIAILVYWLNVLMLGITLFLSWLYADKHGMIKPEADIKSVYRRIFQAQILWLFGTALSLISISLSISFLFLVQLVYALHPQSNLVRRIIG